MLYFYKARYYDPELGRFLQTDLIGYADQMNLYAYVGNDPVNWLDPWGLAMTCIDNPETGNASCVVTPNKRATEPNLPLPPFPAAIGAPTPALQVTLPQLLEVFQSIGETSAGVCYSRHKGRAGEDAIAEALREAGYFVESDSMSIRTPAGWRHPDLYVRGEGPAVDVTTGEVYLESYDGFIEVKVGNSPYRQSQRKKDGYIAAGEGVAGRNPPMNLPPGSQVPPTPTEVLRVHTRACQ